MNSLKRKRRHNRIRAKVKGTPERPRACVFRSNKTIAVQLIDDVSGKTLVAVHGLSSAKKTKMEQAGMVGKHIAEIAKEKGIVSIVFDRGGYLYHGRVKALAEAMREHGLKF